MTDAGVAAVTRPLVSGRRRKWRSILRWMVKYVPLTFYVLFIYTIIQLVVPDVNALFIDFGFFRTTWSTALILIAGLACMWEIERISRPGMDKIRRRPSPC